MWCSVEDHRKPGSVSHALFRMILKIVDIGEIENANWHTLLAGLQELSQKDAKQAR